MALAAVPYGGTLVARQAAGPTSWALTIAVSDAQAVFLRNVRLDIGQAATYVEVLDAIRDLVGTQMVIDAGSRAALVDALIAAGARWSA